MPCLPYRFTLLEASALLVTSGLLCLYILTCPPIGYPLLCRTSASTSETHSHSDQGKPESEPHCLFLFAMCEESPALTESSNYNFTRHREAHSPRSCYPRPYTLLGDQIIIRVSVWSSLEHLTTFFKCYPKSFMQSSFSACLLYDSVCVSLCLLL